MEFIKRSPGEIIAELLPKKSKPTYERAWKAFEDFTGVKESYEEEDFIVYFDFVHLHKSYIASTIWKTFSMLNESYQLRQSFKMQDKFHKP